MNQEIKTCQNCTRSFVIEAEDFAFYEKMKVPAPTFCPECRLQRRLAFANVFQLYKRSCNLCGKEFISRYSPDKTYRAYCPKCYWSDEWDALQYGRDYDFSRPFFEQFNELCHDVPMLGLLVDPGVIESPYVNDAGFLKQCYLVFGANYCERCSYGYVLTGSKDCMDSSFINSCERSHDLFHCFKNYAAIHSQYTIASNNISFSWQCTNCQDCFLSANLRNKHHYILNEPYTPEEYAKKRADYDLGSYRTYTELKEKSKAHRLKFPVRTFWHDFSENVSGLFVFQSRNCKNCFEITGGENCRYTSFILNPTVKDSYDYTSWGNGAELIYEGANVGENARNIQFGEESGLGLYDAAYTKLCTAASDLFGCIGVRKKSYCILNKQYIKEEYEQLVPRIIRHMQDVPYVDKHGRTYRYGEFFPVELSPFAYNETLAHVYYPMTKEESLANGYAWKDHEKSEHRATIRAQDLPDHIRDAGGSILRETIGCAECGRAFRFAQSELAFCREMNVPLARLCFHCRIQEKLKDQPHPMHVWKRRCQCAGSASENGIYTNQASHTHDPSFCVNEFETSYAPDREEIVYCEACYQAEIL